MRRSELKSLGVEDDLIDDIMALHGKSKGKLESRIEVLEDEKQGYIKDIENRDKQLEDIKNSSTDNQEMQDKVNKYEADNAKLKAENARIRLDAAIQLSVANKVHNAEDILLHVDRDKITIDGDTIKGLDEQVAELEKSKPYLFKTTDNTDNTNEGADNDSVNEGEQPDDDENTPIVPNPGAQNGNKGKKKDPAAMGLEMYEKLYGKKEE